MTTNINRGDGTLDDVELQNLDSAIQIGDYGFYTQGKDWASQVGASGTATSGAISVNASGNACNDMKYRCAA